MPLAAVLVLAGFAAIVIMKAEKTKHSASRALKYAAAVTLSAACALFLMTIYLCTIVYENQQLIGSTHKITAQVVSTAQGYTEDSMNVKLRIISADGEKAGGNTFVYSMPSCSVGDVVTFAGEGNAPKKDEYLYYNYANGIFITYNDVSVINAEHRNESLTAVISGLQKAASDAITELLPSDTGAVLAAMSTGDKTKLDLQTKTIFKRAGLSHVLVVSGLHLSMLTSAFFFVLSRFFKRRTTGVITCVFIIFLMLFMGMSASVVRSGIALLLVYSGTLFNRQSDVYTSLGAAALLLCVSNPYAAVDIGLLLSFSSVIAVVIVGEKRLKALRKLDGEPFYKVAAAKLGYAVAVPAAATAATLPVLIAIGEGVSLVSVLTGVITVALLPFVAVLGLCVPVFFYIKPLMFAARLACVLAAVMTDFIIKLASWAANLPFAFIHLYGMSALCIFVLTAILLFCGAKADFSKQKNIFFAAIFVIISAGAYICLDADVVHITLTGNSTNPSLVITKGTDTAVIFRGSQSTSDVSDTLELYNRQSVNILVDLRLSANTSALSDGFFIQNKISGAENVFSAKTCEAFSDIIITVHRQSKGTYAVVGVDGYDVCIAAGKVDLSNEKGIDIYIAGSSEPQNLVCDKIAVYSGQPQWTRIYDSKTVFTNEILVRRGKSVIY